MFATSLFLILVAIMRLILVKKSALSKDQAEYLSTRIDQPEHRQDMGPPRIWNVYPFGLFAFIHIEQNIPVAIAEASGTDFVSPGWWIDSAYRGQGYGNELVDLLAEHLKACGVKHVGLIPIQTNQRQCDLQSEKLAQRFRRHFEAQ